MADPARESSVILSSLVFSPSSISKFRITILSDGPHGPPSPSVGVLCAAGPLASPTCHVGVASRQEISPVQTGIGHDRAASPRREAASSGQRPRKPPITGKVAISFAPFDLILVSLRVAAGPSAFLALPAAAAPRFRISVPVASFSIPTPSSPSISSAPSFSVPSPS